MEASCPLPPSLQAWSLARSRAASTGVSGSLMSCFSSHNMLLTCVCVFVCVSFANPLIPEELKGRLKGTTVKIHYLESTNLDLSPFN